MMKYIIAILLSISTLAVAAPTLPSLNSKAPIEINADSLEVLQKDQIALFKGNVVALQAETEIRSSTMKVFYGKPEKSSNPNAPSISKIEVSGDVRIKTKAESARGQKGVYDVSSGIVRLSGNVTLTKDNNIIKGGSLIIDMNRGYSKIENDKSQGENGRVRGLFTPQ